MQTNIPGLRRGAKLISFRCENKRCPAMGEGVVVQVNPDGSIPAPQVNRGPKQFPELPEDFGRTEIALRNELAQSQTKEGKEVGR